MKKIFTISFSSTEEKLTILVKKNRKAKNIRLYLYKDGQIVVNIPQWVPFRVGKTFAKSKKDYLLAKIKKNKEQAIIPLRNKNDYFKFKNRALRIVRDQLYYFNNFYNFQYNKFFIKNPQTHWGSCSSKGNLNYSYRIIFLPADCRDYIIVHELCHLKEFNHSKNFWNLVEKTIPHYKELIKKIKNI